MGLKDVDFADEADGLPGSETGSAIWMPAAEEMEWLGGLQEFPQFFATGIGLSVGGHAIIQALIKTFALRSMKPGDEGRVTNRALLLLHSLGVVGLGAYWVVAGGRPSRLFGYSKSVQEYKSLSAGFYAYNVLYMATDLRSMPRKKVLAVLFTSQSAWLVCWTIDMAFPLAFSSWLFFFCSLSNLPVIFSSLEYLTRKLRGSLYVMLNLALAKLVAHVAVLAANIYALCAALAFVRANELWNLEGVDKRVSRFAMHFCIGMPICLVSTTYANFVVFQHSVEQIKERYINRKPQAQDTPAEDKHVSSKQASKKLRPTSNRPRQRKK